MLNTPKRPKVDIDAIVHHTRMRRNRKTDWSRRLTRENSLSSNDLIWPIFITDGTAQSTPILSMPEVYRHSIDSVVKQANRAVELGIPVIALFPNTDPSLRDENGSEALNEKNLVCQACRAIRAEGLPVGLMTDAALDPYTSHGHDGVMAGETILNDETVHILCEQSLNQAAAGADIISPSDMMDGRVGAIRRALDMHGFEHVQIMSYAAKYASAFYGPFRDAVGTNATLIGDKRTYQMDPANSDEALREVQMDIDEGADMIMVKPGMPYLDIIRRVKDTFQMPTYGYQVSGEYSMLMAAVQNGWLDFDRVVMESLISFKRSGADGVLTYFAPKIAQILNKHEWSGKD